jgi:hypothetical protein
LYRGNRLSAKVIEPENSWERSHGSLRRILREQATAFVGTSLPQLLARAVDVIEDQPTFFVEWLDIERDSQRRMLIDADSPASSTAAASLP